jgi:hypothetical protein
MKSRHTKKRPPAGAAKVIEEGPEGGEVLAPIHERPDGYYWMTLDGRQEFGPFESYELARLDSVRFDEVAPQPGESLREAEDEIGIADWIDRETGGPAEGESPPHIDET